MPGERIFMKGQFVFEFLIAGIIFFVVVIYSINYLNVNVADFKSKFHQSALQNKAIQVSEVLMKGYSHLSVADDFEFSLQKIGEFNQTYCPPEGDYSRLVGELHLYEKTSYGEFPGDIKIEISNSTDLFMSCGPRVPGSPRADMERLGMLNGGIVRMRVIVW